MNGYWLLRGNIPEEHQDTGHVEIDIPEGVAFVSAYFLVAEYPVIEDCKAASVLVGDNSGQLRVSDHVIL